ELIATTPIPHPRARLLAEGQIPFEAVLAAADVVIAKPGYGIVSDVLANRTPILYIPRRDFSEDPILCRALDEQAVSARMNHKEFMEGQWRRALKKLEERDQRWTPLDLQGAEQIADRVIEKLGNQRRSSAEDIP
ncbi:hypothetical protein JW992_06280, partial [candidate division KSB1 bacterium]|nr:hypothetical protein [candidate division KSB1 bacterium]